MQFNGGDVTIELYAGTGAISATPTSADKARLMQTIKVNLPSGTFPVPNLVSTGTPVFPSPGVAPRFSRDTTPENWWGFAARGVVANKIGRLGFAFDLSGANAAPQYSGNFFRTGNTDVVRSVLPRHGDFRLSAASPFFDDTAAPIKTFVKHPRYDDTTQFIAHTLTSFAGEEPGRDIRGKYLSPVSTGRWNNEADIPAGAALADTPEPTGDFDTGMSTFRDGPYVNKPDEGNNNRAGGAIPYFTIDHVTAPPGPTFFTPNRILRSAGMFGSLPTGVKAGKPWQTLLLRPQTSHPMHSATIPDHLFLDLFWMPVVEPYAISEPFSTAGKINMNYAIAPFSYINRATGIASLLRAERLIAVPNSAAGSIKNIGVGSAWTGDVRLPINTQETLKQWDAKFASNQLFVSSSQICDLHLVPQGETAAGMPTFWNTNALTGDNVRERPYANLLGRLTTKSNSFTVHFRVQVLKKNPNTPANQWVEGRDNVSSEYRGSTLIERYIDPNNTSLPDFATVANANIDDYYRFRVIQTRKFAP
jgi:uncharacterized protein (TIGR02600 family)